MKGLKASFLFTGVQNIEISTLINAQVSLSTFLDKKKIGEQITLLDAWEVNEKMTCMYTDPGELVQKIQVNV